MSVSIDEHTQNALEILSQVKLLTDKTILAILKQLIEFLDSNENKQQVFISNDTKDGKQKIDDLLKKHQNNVYALDQNLTKEQLKDYEKEFKKLGVDFSVTKNRKDNYSFFFSGQQSNIIEKALKNVAELKSAVLENEQVKNAENELNGLKENMSQETVDKVKNLFDEIYDIKEKKNGLSEQLKGLEKELNEQLKELDNVLDEKVKSLTPEELELLQKFEGVAEIKNEVKESIVKENNEIETIENAEEKTFDVDSENKTDIEQETSSEKGVKQENVKSANAKKKKVDFSMNAVKKKDKEIREKSALEDKNKVKEKELSL